MADVFSKAKRSQVMAAIRSKGNKDTEVCLARILRVGGISGWRRHVALPGRPDFVFQKDRVAVFVDGCFWHGCPQHGRKPDSNKRYWNAKIARNKARDRAVTLALKSAGWRVVRIWEHGLKLRNSVTRRVAAALTKRNLEDYR
jgi:DNA mismatch endonuclease (patch repair protein)